MEDNIKELKIKYEEVLKSTNKVLKDNEKFEKKFYKDLGKLNKLLDDGNNE